MYLDDIQKEFDATNQTVRKIMTDEVVAIFDKFLSNIITINSNTDARKKKILELYRVFIRDMDNHPLKYKYEIRNMFEYDIDKKQYKIKENFSIFASVLISFLRVLPFEVDDIRKDFTTHLDMKEARIKRDLEEDEKSKRRHD